MAEGGAVDYSERGLFNNMEGDTILIDSAGRLEQSLEKFCGTVSLHWLFSLLASVEILTTTGR